MPRHPSTRLLAAADAIFQATDLLGYVGSDVTREFHTIELMRRAGQPIAQPLRLEADADQLGMRFLVSRKAIGRTQGGNWAATSR